MQSKTSADRTAFTRRAVIRSGTVMALGALGAAHSLLRADDSTSSEAVPHQATGIKIGEVTASSAVVWVRLTQMVQRLADDNAAIKPLTGNREGKANAETLPGACPAISGSVRLLFGRGDDFADAQTTEWVAVTAEQDGIHQFTLSNLPSDSLVHVRVECRSSAGKVSPTIVTGRFRTAPSADDDVAITGVVLGCHQYQMLDHPDGFTTYHSAAQLNPHFMVQTGDNVYYDRDIGPFATTVPLARWQWQRMFSLPRHRALIERVACYWEKDDHDTLTDDSWPGKTFGDLTYAKGAEIFKSQTPSGTLPYRTFRWGRHVQIWLVEVRDYRTPNSVVDGPDKTIWGAEQKAWLKTTMADSTATWKILISPTPIVGPDRGLKNDNHANAGFQHEGDEIRAWLKAHVADQVIVVNGDRHWQYHSVHPHTGLHEFSTGPTSDGLADGSPGEDKTYHRFHRVKGGFVSFAATVTHDLRTLSVRHHAADGAVVHEQVFTQG